MAQPTDKIDAEILPDPELNPLLNPLLGAHMGRWAEVYFTSPPEKRSQAVYDLIQELKSHSPVEPASVPPVIGQRQREEETEEQEEAQKIVSVEPRQQPSPPVAELRQTCSICSADNSGEQRFCGMCGAPLPSSSQTDDSRFLAVEPAFEENWSETHSSGEPEFSIGSYAAGDAAEHPLIGDYARRDFSRRKWPLSEADLPHFAKESESVPYRYRLYVGIAVAFVLGALLYMAWHRTPGSSPGSSGDVSDSVPSRVIPAAPSRATPASTPEPSAKRAVLPTDQATARPPVPSAPAAAGATERPVERKNQEETSAHRDQTPQAARAAEPRIVPVAENSSITATANDQSGEEELATAEKYLNGGNRGVPRDNREAAEWLWKAVGKGNLAATMVLSDLYLRGDGIPKNCDQARLLLDAAARKGKASAGERLRNLQAFGCQ